MRGVRVVELGSSITSAYCTRLFATAGADVVVVEPAEGAALRRTPPFLDAEQMRSAAWEHLAAGKRSVVADIDDASVDELLRWADLVVACVDGAPDDGVALAARVAALNSAAVTTVTSAFGLTGPYRTWRSSPLGDWASGGHLFLTGQPDREPVQGGGPWDTYLAGAVAAVGSAGAVIHAARTGEGQLVDVSVMEALAAMHQWTVAMYTHTGCIKRRWGNVLGESSHPIGLYGCADGFISIVAVTQVQWEALCVAMELWDLMIDPALTVIAERFDRREEIDGQINVWLSTRTVDEAVDYLQGKGVPASRLLTMSQVLREPQLELREFFAAPDGLGDGAAMPWMPFRCEGRAVPFAAAPAIGADTAAVAVELSLAARTPRGSRPSIDLHRVRVLEFGIAWAGPLAGRFLGELGADVVKVEHPATRGIVAPDRRYTEGWQWGTLTHPQIRFGVYPNGDPGEHWWNRSGIFNKINRSKRSVSLDLKTEDGAVVFAGLVAASDVVLNNYSPRGARSVGADPASARRNNPRAITVSMSGYGANGPLAGNLSYGPVLQAHGGFDEATGYLGGTPTRLGVAYPDAVGGTHGAFAILTALWERELTGAPVAVDVSQLETLLSIAGDMLLATSVSGADPVRHGNRAEGLAPQGVYPTLGDDEWIAITVDGDDTWHALVDEIGEATLVAHCADDLAARVAAHDVLDARVAAWTATLDRFEIARRLQAQRVIAVPVMTNQDLVEDEHMVTRGFVAMVDQPDVGMIGFPGAAFHMSATPLRCGPCPALGGDNAAVLAEYLGLDATRVEELLANGTLADRPLGQ